MKTTASRASAVSQTRGLGDLLYDKAGSRPSLDLDFVGTQSLKDKITGEDLVTHTRTSNGTYIDNAGVIKKAAFNLSKHSEILYANATCTITANSHLSPRQTMTADTVAFNAGNATTWLTIEGSPLASGHYVVSIHARSVSSTNSFRFKLYNDSTTWYSPDFSTTTEWQRFEYTFNDAVTGIALTNPASGTASTNVFWGHQLETGTTATDYIATPTSSPGGAPRFTHERVETGNLLKDTRFLDPAYLGNVEVLNYRTTAPDNTYSASEIRVTSAASAFKFANPSTTHITFKPNTPYTVSVYFKAGTHDVASIFLSQSGNLGATFNFTNVTASAVGGQNTARITAAGNGWYRCEVTNDGASTVSNQIRIGVHNGAVASNTMAVGKSIYVWGLQLDEGEAATTFVPSTDTFTSRASNATYVDSEGTIKTAYRNLLTYSEEFEPHWTKFNSAIDTTATTAPNGTQTAQKLKLNTTNNAEHGVFHSATTSTDTTFSVYAKKAEMRYLVLRRDGGSNRVSVFDLEDGVVTQADSGCISSMVNVGDGWYRCIMTTPGSSNSNAIFKLSDVATGVVYQSYSAGNVNDGIYIWGAQLVNGTEAGDYVKTGATATGAARYSHDPTTLTATGLYLEPAATNYLKYSEDFSQWDIDSHNGATASITSTTHTNPAGKASSYLIEVDGTGNSNNGLVWVETDGATSLTAGQHTASVWLKAATANDVGKQVYFWQYDGSEKNGTTINLPAEWTRFTMNNSDSLTNNVGEAFNIGHHSSHISSAAIKSFYIWGAQLEAGTFATSYTPTTSATVTRAADTYTSTANLTETFEPRGLLIEESRANYFQANRTNFGVIALSHGGTENTSSYATAPDGTQTAKKLGCTATVSGGPKHFRVNSLVSSFVNNTLSFYVKKLVDDPVTIDTDFNDHINNDGIVLTNDWQRITLSGVPHNYGQMFLDIGIQNKTGSDLIAVWGAQLELGTFATSYIYPASDSAATTRAADVASITGDNFGTYRTNLKPNSTILGMDWNVTDGYVEPYAALSPDGKYNAVKFIENTDDYFHHISHNFNGVSGKVYQLSAYFKADTEDEVALKLYTGSSYVGRAVYDLTSVSVITRPQGTAASIEAVGDGWYRCSLTCSASDNTGAHTVYLAIKSIYTYAGTGKTCFMWGPQVEEGTSTTNYIPSTDTFTSRLGNATYVDSAGLIKTAYRNLFTDSETFLASSNWLVSATAAGGKLEAADALAPNGTQTAERFTAYTGNADGHMFSYGYSTSNKTASIYGKAGTLDHLSVIFHAGPTLCQGVQFNLTNGTIVTSQNATGTIEDVGQGWYRCSVTPTTNTTASHVIIHPNGGETPDTSARFRSTYAGAANDGSYMWVWGAQLVDGTEAGDYVKTTGTATGAPRYSHDPTTLTPTDLYLEPAVTNYARRTQIVNSVGVLASPWGGTGSPSITANAAIAPDGTQTATLLKPTTGTAIINQNTGGGNYRFMFSAFVKSAGYRYFGMGMVGPASGSIIFDIINGTVAHSIYSNPNQTIVHAIEKYPNGWYRLSIKSDALTGTAVSWTNLHLNKGLPADGNTNWHGASTNLDDFDSGVYIWGINKTRDGRLSPPIISNENEDTTRAADTYASAATTVLDRDGGNKEAFWSPTANTSYGDMKFNSSDLWPRLYESYSASNAQVQNLFFLHSNGFTNFKLSTQAALQAELQINAGISDGDLVKFTGTYQLNDAQAASNGILHGSGDQSVALHVLPNDSKKPVAMRIGDRQAGDRTCNSPIARITHWKTRLPDANLINITQ